MSFKIDDKVRVVADKERLEECGLINSSLTGEVGKIVDDVDQDLRYDVKFDSGRAWFLAEHDLELVEEQPTTLVGHPDGGLEKVIKEFTLEPGWKDSGGTGPPIRKFVTGATRDTVEGKLSYVKGLSPIVLRRYLEYLNAHRLQSDGSMRNFDNWKKGIDQDTYLDSGFRHSVADWLISEGYVVEDNHGSVNQEDTLCAIMFNAMGKLHEILKARLTRMGRTTPTEGEYRCEQS